MLGYILAAAGAVLLLAADQISKYFVAANYELFDEFSIIPNIFDFRYIRNTGGAWGMLSGKTWLLIILTAIIMAGVVIWLVKKKIKNKMLFTAVCLILAGGLGNMADRIFRSGSVIDFIQFAFWKEFPVFNIADCGICIGAGLLILYLILDMIKDYKEKRKTENANH